ncbi:hypothetical protein HPP92_013038 [Vanilla planifolia]|uniref:C2H2-type domain-containing protein n=1 Tax=Vanilla planifolia TaxID=51239 RepID=A0A835QXY3_VANPL|nr:hypothetical protein HPP92_013038 [Vanilla planifolia]
MCEFCRNPFYGDAELYMHMSTEHYTCHLCKRLRPDQYDYYSNYDDLEAHFHQEHFLCENEACLTKKFVVFQSEAEMKRHNAMEHGGHMSRSKRNSALQIPVSFRYRRTNEQDQRRARREFRPGPSNVERDAAAGGSYEFLFDGKTNGEDGETRQADIITNSAEAQAVSSGYESSGNGSSIPNLDLPKPSIRYALAVTKGYTAKLGESSFPPLPGAESKIKNPAALSEGLPTNTPAARVDVLNKGSATSLHSASTKSSKFYELGSSSLSSSSKQKPVSKSHDLAQSNSNPGAANQFPQLFSSSSNHAKPIIGNQFTASVHINSVRNSDVATRLKHSVSAPSLTSSAPSNNSRGRTVYVATSNQELPTPNNSMQNLENVHRANKSLVENIRVALGMDEEKYAAFKTISAEYRLNQINTWEYLLCRAVWSFASYF